MQEFESISASSYDPSALATKLTAKAAEGWSVVAIVPTGGDVTAFVSREKAGGSESTKTPEAVKAPEAATATETTETIEAIAVTAEEEPSSLELPAHEETKPDEEPESEAEPVTEPSGWAIAPEPATPSTSTLPKFEPTGVQPAVTIQPATTYQPSETPSFDPTGAATAATTPASATPAATPDPAPAPAVPSGWYADPAGRFELRYWDGTTWTEHVSRAGQQFTDPPVA
jgi:hypothetical protein